MLTKGSSKVRRVYGAFYRIIALSNYLQRLYRGPS